MYDASADGGRIKGQQNVGDRCSVTAEAPSGAGGCRRGVEIAVVKRPVRAGPGRVFMIVSSRDCSAWNFLLLPLSPVPFSLSLSLSLSLFLSHFTHIAMHSYLQHPGVNFAEI